MAKRSLAALLAFLIALSPAGQLPVWAVPQSSSPQASSEDNLPQILEDLAAARAQLESPDFSAQFDALTKLRDRASRIKGDLSRPAGDLAKAAEAALGGPSPAPVKKELIPAVKQAYAALFSTAYETAAHHPSLSGILSPVLKKALENPFGPDRPSESMPGNVVTAAGGGTSQRGQGFTLSQSPQRLGLDAPVSIPAPAAAVSDPAAAISRRVEDLVTSAPYRFGDAPAKAKDLAAFSRKWNAEIAAIQGDAKSANLPADSRAAALVRLLGAMKEQGKDATWFDQEERRRFLLGEGGASGRLGSLGQAIIKQVEQLRQTREATAAQQAAFHANAGRFLDGLRSAARLSGSLVPTEEDKAALDRFFDQGNISLLQNSDLPQNVYADWIAARAAERSGAQPAPGSPSTAEAYRNLVLSTSVLMNERARAGTTKTEASVYLAQYDVNLKSYLALGCDPARLKDAQETALGAQLVSITGRAARALPQSAPPRAGTSRPAAGKVRTAAPREAAALSPEQTAAYCEAFIKDGSLSKSDEVSADRLKAQQRLTDMIRPWLENSDLGRKLAAKTEAENALRQDLRNAPEELKRKIRERGGDIDGAAGEEDPVLRLAATAVELCDPRSDPACEAETSALADYIATRHRGALYRRATEEQSAQLEQCAGRADLAACAGSVLKDIENPTLVTEGLARAIPRLLASPRAPTAARDRVLLAAWQGDGKEGSESFGKSYRGRMLAKAQERGTGEKDKAVLLKAAADPSDTENLLEAFRLIGVMVYDGRTLRVGLDGLPAKPASKEEKARDLEAARALWRELGAQGLLDEKEAKRDFNPSRDSGRMRELLPQLLKGHVAEDQRKNRRYQLLLSMNDELGDRLESVSRIVENLATSREFANLQDDLDGLSGKFKAYHEAEASANKAVMAARNDEKGRAALALQERLQNLKASSFAALYDAYTANGFSVSGWLVGEKGTVTRVRDYKSGGVERAPPAGQDFFKDFMHLGAAPRFDLPKPRTMDGLVVQGTDGSAVFRRGSYSETIFTGASEGAKPPVVTILTETGHARTTITRRGNEILSWSREELDGRHHETGEAVELDFAGRSETVSHGGQRVRVALNDKCTDLADGVEMKLSVERSAGRDAKGRVLWAFERSQEFREEKRNGASVLIPVVTQYDNQESAILKTQEGEAVPAGVTAREAVLKLEKGHWETVQVSEEHWRENDRYGTYVPAEFKTVWVDTPLREKGGKTVQVSVNLPRGIAQDKEKALKIFARVHGLLLPGVDRPEFLSQFARFASFYDQRRAGEKFEDVSMTLDRRLDIQAFVTYKDPKTGQLKRKPDPLAPRWRYAELSGQSCLHEEGRDAAYDYDCAARQNLAGLSRLLHGQRAAIVAMNAVGQPYGFFGRWQGSPDGFQALSLRNERRTADQLLEHQLYVNDRPTPQWVEFEKADKPWNEVWAERLGNGVWYGCGHDNMGCALMGGLVKGVVRAADKQLVYVTLGTVVGGGAAMGLLRGGEMIAGIGEIVGSSLLEAAGAGIQVSGDLLAIGVEAYNLKFRYDLYKGGVQAAQGAVNCLGSGDVEQCHDAVAEGAAMVAGLGVAHGLGAFMQTIGLTGAPEKGSEKPQSLIERVTPREIDAMIRHGGHALDVLAPREPGGTPAAVPQGGGEPPQRREAPGSEPPAVPVEKPTVPREVPRAPPIVEEGGGQPPQAVPLENTSRPAPVEERNGGGGVAAQGQAAAEHPVATAGEGNSAQSRVAPISQIPGAGLDVQGQGPVAGEGRDVQPAGPNFKITENKPGTEGEGAQTPASKPQSDGASAQPAAQPQAAANAASPQETSQAASQNAEGGAGAAQETLVNKVVEAREAEQKAKEASELAKAQRERADQVAREARAARQEADAEAPTPRAQAPAEDAAQETGIVPQRAAVELKPEAAAESARAEVKPSQEKPAEETPASPRSDAQGSAGPEPVGLAEKPQEAAAAPSEKAARASELEAEARRQAEAAQALEQIAANRRAVADALKTEAKRAAATSRGAGPAAELRQGLGVIFSLVKKANVPLVAPVVGLVQQIKKGFRAILDYFAGAPKPEDLKELERGAAGAAALAKHGEEAARAAQVAAANAQLELEAATRSLPAEPARRAAALENIVRLTERARAARSRAESLVKQALDLAEAAASEGRRLAAAKTKAEKAAAAVVPPAAEPLPVVEEAAARAETAKRAAADAAAAVQAKLQEIEGLRQKMEKSLPKPKRAKKSQAPNVLEQYESARNQLEGVRRIKRVPKEQLEAARGELLEAEQALARVAGGKELIKAYDSLEILEKTARQRAATAKKGGLTLEEAKKKAEAAPAEKAPAPAGTRRILAEAARDLRSNNRELAQKIEKAAQGLPRMSQQQAYESAVELRRSNKNGNASVERAARALLEYAYPEPWPVDGTQLVVGGIRAEGFPQPQPGDVYLNVDPSANAHITGDILATRFPDGAFNQVYFERLNYEAMSQKDSPGAMAETARILKPGGRLIIETGANSFRVEDVLPAMQAAGYKDITITLRDSHWKGGIGVLIDIVATKGAEPAPRLPAESNLSAFPHQAEVEKFLKRAGAMHRTEALVISRLLIGTRGHPWRLEVFDRNFAQRIADLQKRPEIGRLEGLIGHKFTWPDFVFRETEEIAQRTAPGRAQEAFNAGTPPTGPPAAEGAETPALAELGRQYRADARAAKAAADAAKSERAKAVEIKKTFKEALDSLPAKKRQAAKKASQEIAELKERQTTAEQSARSAEAAARELGTQAEASLRRLRAEKKGRLGEDPVLKIAALERGPRQEALEKLRWSDMPPRSLGGKLARPIETLKRLFRRRLLSPEEVASAIEAHGEKGSDLYCEAYECGDGQLVGKARIMRKGGTSQEVVNYLLENGYLGGAQSAGGEALNTAAMPSGAPRAGLMGKFAAVFERFFGSKPESPFNSANLATGPPPANETPAQTRARVDNSPFLEESHKAEVRKGGEKELEWAGRTDATAREAARLAAEFLGLPPDTAARAIRLALKGFPLEDYHAAIHALEVSLGKLRTLQESARVAGRGWKPKPEDRVDFLSALFHDSVGEVRRRRPSRRPNGGAFQPPAVGETLHFLKTQEVDSFLRAKVEDGGAGLEPEQIKELEFLIKKTRFTTNPDRGEIWSKRFNQEILEHYSGRPQAIGKLTSRATALSFYDQAATYSQTERTLQRAVEGYIGLAREQGVRVDDLMGKPLPSKDGQPVRWYLDRLEENDVFQRAMKAQGGKIWESFLLVKQMADLFKNIHQEAGKVRGRVEEARQAIDRIFEKRGITEFFRSRGLESSLAELREEMVREIVEPPARPVDLVKEFQEYQALLGQKGLTSDPGEAVELYLEAYQRDVPLGRENELRVRLLTEQAKSDAVEALQAENVAMEAAEIADEAARRYRTAAQALPEEKTASVMRAINAYEDASDQLLRARDELDPAVRARMTQQAAEARALAYDRLAAETGPEIAALWKGAGHARRFAEPLKRKAAELRQKAELSRQRAAQARLSAAPPAVKSPAEALEALAFEPPAGRFPGGAGGVTSSGKTMRALMTGLIGAEMLPYSAGPREARPVSLPMRLEDVARASVKRVTDIVLASEFHSGSAGLVRLAYLEDGRPVALKTYYPDSEAVSESEFLQMMFSEARSAQLLSQLGIGPEFHGIWKDADGRWNVAMDIAPGDFHAMPVTDATFSDLEIIISRLQGARLTDLGDCCQRYRTPDGRLTLIDPHTAADAVGREPAAPFESKYGDGTAMRLSLIADADPEVARRYLSKLRQEKPEAYRALADRLPDDLRSEGFRAVESAANKAVGAALGGTQPLPVPEAPRTAADSVKSGFSAAVRRIASGPVDFVRGFVRDLMVGERGLRGDRDLLERDLRKDSERADYLFAMADGLVHDLGNKLSATYGFPKFMDDLLAAETSPAAARHRKVYQELASRMAVLMARCRFYREAAKSLYAAGSPEASAAAGGLRAEIERLQRADRDALGKVERLELLRNEMEKDLTGRLNELGRYVEDLRAEAAKELPPGREAAAAPQAILRSFDGLTDIVGRYQNLSRKAAGRLNVGPVDIVSLLKKAVQNERDAAQAAGIELSIAAPEGIPPVLGDSYALSVILENLVGNARKYMLPDSKIKRITLRVVRDPAKPGLVTISVEDTGIGIKKEYLDRVTKGLRTPESMKVNTGSGRGLQTVKMLVEAHGSEFGVHSEGEGKGSRFSFDLAEAPGKPAGGKPARSLRAVLAALGLGLSRVAGAPAESAPAAVIGGEFRRIATPAVSHDIRAPIAVDMGYSELLLKPDGEADLRERELLRSIRDWTALLKRYAHHSLDRQMARLKSSPTGPLPDIAEAVGYFNEGLSEISDNIRQLKELSAKRRQKGLAHSPDWDRTLEVMESSTRMGFSLGNTFLRLSRDEPPRREPIRVRSAIVGIMDAVKFQAESSRTSFIVEIPDDVVVEGDPGLFSTWVMNVLSNDVHYARGKPVRIGLIREGSSARLVIKDNGPGMEPQPAKEVGKTLAGPNPLAKMGQSYGLGLFIAHQAASRMGASFEAESEGLGTGMTFSIRMPVSEAGSATPPESARTAGAEPQPRAGKLRKMVEVAGYDEGMRRAKLKELKASAVPAGTIFEQLADPAANWRRWLGLRLLSDEQVEAVIRAHNEVYCELFTCTWRQYLAKVRIMQKAGIRPEIREMMIREAFAGSLPAEESGAPRGAPPTGPPGSRAHFQAAYHAHLGQWARLGFYENVYLKDNPRLSDSVLLRRELGIASVDSLSGTGVAQASDFMNEFLRAYPDASRQDDPFWSSPLLRDKFYIDYLKNHFKASPTSWRMYYSEDTLSQLGATTRLDADLKKFIRDAGHRGVEGLSVPALKDYLYRISGLEGLSVEEALPDMESHLRAGPEGGVSLQLAEDLGHPNGLYASARPDGSHAEAVRAPKNGQAALDHSWVIGKTSPRRIGVDRGNREIVVFDPTVGSEYHGFVTTSDQLTDDMKAALIKGGMASWISR